MGCGASAGAADKSEESRSVQEAREYEKQGSSSGLLSLFKRKRSSTIIPDLYSTYAEVREGLRNAGLESSQLVIGVDFTVSNTWNGKRSFGASSLHDVNGTQPNPYMEVLRCISTALKDFDSDNLIPAYGFGDARTKQHSIFSFQTEDEPCIGLDGVLEVYKQLADTVMLAGPTSFAPLIRHTIDLVRKTNEYHILVIVADGMVEHPQETIDAIIEASSYAMSIIMIGVGDGDWDLMEYFDDGMRARYFDNFQFVKFSPVVDEMEECADEEERDAHFAMRALMEVPDQYAYIKEAGLLRPDRVLPPFDSPPAVLDPPQRRAKPEIASADLLRAHSTGTLLRGPMPDKVKPSTPPSPPEPIYLAAHSRGASPTRRSRRRYDARAAAVGSRQSVTGIPRRSRSCELVK